MLDVLIKSLGGRIHSQVDRLTLNDNYKVHIVDDSTHVEITLQVHKWTVSS